VSEISIELIFTASVAGIFSAMLFALILYYREHRKARYNEVNNRVELEMLRESLEKKIYELTDKLMSTEDRWEDLNHILVSRLETQPESVEFQNTLSLTNFLKSYGLKETDTAIDPNLVFVLTPFNEQFAESFNIIARTCRDLGLRCLRGDEAYVRGDIFPHILRHILKARIIVANIDGRNPNVFYELGIAHALDKVTILVTKSIKSVPFDLRGKKLVVYQDADELRLGLQNELSRSLLREQI